MSAEIDSAVIGDGAAQGPAVPRSESVKSAYRTLQLLAARSTAEVDALLPATLVALTPDTVTDRQALDAELAETRLRGWAFESGQNTPGLCCFGVAIPSAQPPVYAMSCSIPLARLTEEHRRSVVAALTECADELRYAARH